MKSRGTVATCHLILYLLVSTVTCVYDKGVSQIDKNSPAHAREFSTFVTRPDIDAPRWNISLYDEAALGPGYWFMATYEYVEQDNDENRAWIGPYIYDQHGELIWSGAPAFEGYNIKDFRISNVGGVDMLTGIYGFGGFGVVLNSSYQVHELVGVEDDGSSINIHDFHTVDEGDAYLAMTLKSTPASEELLSKIECVGHSKLEYPGFEERDSQTLQLRFAWSAEGHIDVNESFVKPVCNGVWDFLHANSVDKFPDGDYLLCGRHTDTLYKISGQDGTVLWRFGGKQSDFAFQGHFSGQHDARIVAHDGTYTVISILDNAIRPGLQPTTNDHSRGMLIGLHTDTMVASVLQTYTHPHGGYAVGRGNLQMLGNGNAFLGWWMQGLISEYTSDGRLLMDASWLPRLKSYRSYKFDWVGHPAEPPDVVARSAWIEGRMQTMIYVSWNGATEVDQWVVYKASGDDGPRKRLAAFKRTGFETAFKYDGFERDMIIEAIDRSGSPLGESLIVTIEQPKRTRWMYGFERARRTRISAFALCSLLVVCVLVGVSLGLLRKRRFLMSGCDLRGQKLYERDILRRSKGL